MIEQRVLAITGASSGIGAALALRAARYGYAIVATGRNSEALTALTQHIALEGGLVTTLIGDVRSPLTSERIAATALEAFGRLDVLVANAGVAGRGPLALQTDEELLEQLETHVMAPITLIRTCLPLLSRSRGCVVVLGSGVARMPIAGMGLYPASKAALRSASRTLRGELAPLGIGLTYVDPGAVDTEFMHRRSMPGAPRYLLVSPHRVARRILAAIPRRPAEINVVPWQTALLGIAELFPRLTDAILTRAGSVTGAPSTLLAAPTHAHLPSADLSTTSPAANTLATTLTPAAYNSRPTLLTATAEVPTTTPVEQSALEAPQPPTINDRLTDIFAPFSGRMRRLNFPDTMLRTRLVADSELNEDTIALDWVGMPNKNERKLITELCAACAAAGFLEPNGERQWRIIPQNPS